MNGMNREICITKMLIKFHNKITNIIGLVMENHCHQIKGTMLFKFPKIARLINKYAQYLLGHADKTQKLKK